MLAALGLSTQLSPTAAPASAPQAELRLSVDRAVVARGENPGYHLTIRNLGRTPLRLSDLQSGSAVGAVNPSADWVTPDLRGVDAMLNCGDCEAVRASRFLRSPPARAASSTRPRSASPP